MIRAAMGRAMNHFRRRTAIGPFGERCSPDPGSGRSLLPPWEPSVRFLGRKKSPALGPWFRPVLSGSREFVRRFGVHLGRTGGANERRSPGLRGGSGGAGGEHRASTGAVVHLAVVGGRE